ncbi:2-amino-4-hydroxy-6-hydroxymethyldihydropteridine diphosphokinase [Salirhabdus euzebyi]|uniref:2-amino-4-hydroxy-6-hydroxymethyldihydropteridine diphosphokinase n=1 Tax=Salirhabdus euzebyi TaxID=394506 RepID=A0A841Q9T9_9BACI|nr:2-amino-4-hydroxy-6-hydroxymethyldihydropteridine diphosphokinase [Salirhabdus euzebyi]MBB6455271.1 2-amino-4-hydroxy-6-hydroxymethyldihydropteridine diphosphokinase [Salirhabdus euzebyi]
MNKAYIALGSNIEPREQYLGDAIKKLNEHHLINVTEKSSIYETEPVGYEDQQSFLNMVVQLETSLEPFELLYYCQQIESNLGRKRVVRWGPRTVDLDIIVYNQENIDTEKLKIPHPRMLERAFVLVPLEELASSLKVNGLPVHIHLSRLNNKDRKGVTKWNQLTGE